MISNDYGRGDSTFLALGGIDGIRELVDAFYTTMEREEDYKVYGPCTQKIERPCETS